MKRTPTDPLEHRSSNHGEIEQALPTCQLDDSAAEQDSATIPITEDEIIEILQQGEMHELKRLPFSSNYNLLVLIRSAERELPAVYKPRRGENPLWDFTTGTLCQREVAAYQVNAMLGWSLVPPTVLREGIHGTGSVQLYIDHNSSEHYFTVQEDALFAAIFRQLALFDFITNNADRKSGHCLIDHAHRLWAIDHGICFHEEYKLRTVIWEFSGQPIEDELLQDIENLYTALSDLDLCGTPMSENDYTNAGYYAHNDDFAKEFGLSNPLADHWRSNDSSQLAQLLSPTELSAIYERTSLLLAARTYPEPMLDRRNYPWPPV